MIIADRIREGAMGSSMIRKMFEEGNRLKKIHGEENIFDLSIGNPIMEPPPEFNEELKRLAAKPAPGMHRYMENAGYAETRAAVAAQLSIETGVKFNENEIIMTCGSAAALNVVTNTILNKGDRIIIFAPYFMEYINYTENFYGEVKIVASDDRFIPRLDILEKAITARTRAIIINSPHNPTGVVYSEDFLHQLGELLQKKESKFGTKILLVSDEPYRKIIYDGLKYPYIWPHHPNSIAVSSHSKDLGLAGERIGYIAVNPACAEKEELINALIYCNRTLGYVNAPALMQHLVRNLQNACVSIAEYQRKRDFVYHNLTEMGYSMIKPQGAFYFFPRTPIPDDNTFTSELAQYHVLVVPGSSFGGPGHFRIAYCIDDRTLQGAMAGFRQAAQRYGLC